MTREELKETLCELAENSDIFSSSISDKLRETAALLQRDGETIAALEAERDQLRAELANLKALLRSICEEWNEGCDPACDSFGHTDTCKGTNIAQAKRAMRDEIERLRAELAEYRQDAERYRWLRDWAGGGTITQLSHIEPDAWDAFVDGEMEESK